MKKDFFLLASFLWLMFFARPPVVAQTLVGSAGVGDMSAGGFKADYAVGEVVTATIVGTPSVTQGVLQPHYFINATNDLFDSHYSIKCYPNPVKDELIIETNYPDFKTIELYNALGQLVLTRLFDGQSLNMSAVPMGNYVLFMASKEKTITKSIKIIKQ